MMVKIPGEDTCQVVPLVTKAAGTGEGLLDLAVTTDRVKAFMVGVRSVQCSCAWSPTALAIVGPQ